MIKLALVCKKILGTGAKYSKAVNPSPLSRVTDVTTRSVLSLVPKAAIDCGWVTDADLYNQVTPDASCVDQYPTKPTTRQAGSHPRA